MISFRCPRCKNRMNRDDQEAGQKVVCTACGQKLQVPQPPPFSNLQTEAPLIKGNGPAQEKFPRLTPFLIGAAVGGVLLVVGLVIFLFFKTATYEGPASVRIVNSWFSGNGDLRYDFHSDGTFALTVLGTTLKGKYRVIDENNVEMEFLSKGKLKKAIQKFSVSEDQLRIWDEKGDGQVLQPKLGTPRPDSTDRRDVGALRPRENGTGVKEKALLNQIAEIRSKAVGRT